LVEKTDAEYVNLDKKMTAKTAFLPLYPNPKN
jgi:hypothetical protein